MLTRERCDFWSKITFSIFMANIIEYIRSRYEINTRNEIVAALQRVLWIYFASFLLTSFISKLDENEKNVNPE